MLNLILVRHGETDWNHEQRIQGQLDIPLNKNGTKQARAVFSKLKKEPIDAIFSSDLTRAMETVTPFKQLGFSINLDSNLRERSLGMLEGLCVKEAVELMPEDLRAFQTRSYAVTPKNSESMSAFEKRIRVFLSKISETYERGNILAVTHGGVIDVVWRIANNISPTDPVKPTVTNGSIHRLQLINNGGVVIENFNDVDHMKAMSHLDDV